MRLNCKKLTSFNVKMATPDGKGCRYVNANLTKISGVQELRSKDPRYKNVNFMDVLVNLNDSLTDIRSRLEKIESGHTGSSAVSIPTGLEERLVKLEELAENEELRGPPGPRGPAGPAGKASKGAKKLSDLEDVNLDGVKNGSVLVYQDGYIVAGEMAEDEE